MRGRQQGQVLALFAIMVTGILAMLALAIDVSSAYSTRQSYRTASDAAALAGGQDLQATASRAVTAAEYAKARADSKLSLQKQFSATLVCAETGARSNCTLSNGLVASVVTPIPAGSCATCDPTRSIQVSVTNPNFRLSFGPVVGVNTWNVGTTSVAGLQFGGQYAIITLRPPVSGRTGNKDDILINGTNSAVIADGGDIGSNTGSTLNGHTATVQVGDGYFFRYYGALADPSTPAGSAKQLLSLIPDPKYPYPSATAATPVGGPIACPATTAATLTSNGYGTYTASQLECYKPGTFASTLSVNNNKVGVLLPGLYYLNKGIDLKGTLLGGYQPGVTGVALIVPYTEQVKLTGTPPFFALNRGTNFDGRAGGQDALPVLTTNETTPTMMSIVVTGNSACKVVVPAPNCNSTTLDFSGFGGHGFVSIAGVIYAPSDNVKVAGNGDSRGYTGRIVAWTITYSGGSTLVQHYVGAPAQGVLRLDAACTVPSTPCNP